MLSRKKTLICKASVVSKGLPSLSKLQETDDAYGHQVRKLNALWEGLLKRSGCSQSLPECSWKCQSGFKERRRVSVVRRMTSLI